ncbi:MAG: FAD-dependent oxidoreductase [Bdellovibrionota bacterium]
MSGVKWAVVGRGIVGLTCAYRLLQSGVKVVVFGPQFDIKKASSAAVGVSSVKGLIYPRKDLFAARLAGHYFLWELLLELEALDVGSVGRIQGVFELITDEVEKFRVQKRVFGNNLSQLFDKNYLEHRCFVDSEFLSEIYKDCPYNGAFSYPSDYWFDPEGLLITLEKAILKLGGQLVDTKVDRILPADHSPISKQYIVELECHEAQEKYRKDLFHSVLLAVGVSTNEILNRSNLTSFPLKEAKGFSLKADILGFPNGALKQGKRSLAVYDQTIRFGSIESYELAESSKENIFDEEQIHLKFKNLLETEFKISSVRLNNSKLLSGIRVVCEDRLPIFGSYNPFVDKSGYKLWVASGFYKNGFFLSDYCARYLQSIVRHDLASMSFSFQDSFF